MKLNGLCKKLSLLLVICIVFVGFSFRISAESYVYNRGERGKDCTELSSYAKDFYTGIYVFEDMSQTQGGTSQSNAHSSALYSELKTLMTSKHTHITSYEETKSLYKYTDCQKGGGKISSFYSGKEIGPNWGEGSWNREHTWPNSKGLGGSDENDIMMLRPTSTSENSSRGNTAYGKSSGYYDPNSESNGKYNLHGDVARIVLYVYVRWGNTSYMWGSSGVMENLTVLLEWMEEDPVDTWEMGRNDAVQSITGTRNVFVDYPEYAWLLFGRDVPKNLVSPSGNAGTTGGSNPGSTGGNTGGSTGGETSSKMTVAEALAAADGTAVTVTGTVTSIDSKYGWNGTSMSANLGDGSGNEIYLYKLSTEVKVGDNITVSGTKYTYDGLKEIKDITSVTINSDGNTGGSTGGSTGGNTGGSTGEKPSAGGKITYTFSEYSAGVQYAKNETHKLDDTLTVVTDDAHFTTQIRLYHTDNTEHGAHHATAVFKSTKEISALAVNAGHKADVLKVSGSNDGSTWVLIDEISVAASYADHDVDMQGEQYKYIKLESTETQIRVASISVTYVSETIGTDPDDSEKETTGVDETTDSEGATTEEGTNAEEGTNTEEGTKTEEGTNTEEGTKAEEGTNPEEGTKIEEGTKAEEGTNPEEGTSSSGKPLETETTTVETGKQPGVDKPDNSTEEESIIMPNKGGCGSSLCGGIAIIISVSAAGIVFCRKKKD